MPGIFVDIIWTDDYVQATGQGLTINHCETEGPGVLTKLFEVRALPLAHDMPPIWVVFIRESTNPFGQHS